MTKMPFRVEKMKKILHFENSWIKLGETAVESRTLQALNLDFTGMKVRVYRHENPSVHNALKIKQIQIVQNRNKEV